MVEDQRVNLILEYTSIHFGIDVDTIKSKLRSKEVVAARQCAMYLIKQLLSYSLKQTGYLFGGRDHSTVIHAMKTILKDDSYAGNVADVFLLEEQLEKELDALCIMQLPHSNIELSYGSNQNLFGIYKMSII